MHHSQDDAATTLVAAVATCAKRRHYMHMETFSAEDEFKLHLNKWTCDHFYCRRPSLGPLGNLAYYFTSTTV